MAKTTKTETKAHLLSSTALSRLNDDIRNSVTAIAKQEAKAKSAKKDISEKSMILAVQCGEYFRHHGTDKETVESFNKDQLANLSRQARDKVSGTAASKGFQNKLDEVINEVGSSFKPKDFINVLATDFPNEGDKVNSMNSLKAAFQDKAKLMETRFEGLDVATQTFAEFIKLASQLRYDDLQNVLLTIQDIGPDKTGAGVIPSDKLDPFYLAVLAALTPIAKSLDTKKTDNG